VQDVVGKRPPRVGGEFLGDGHRLGGRELRRSGWIPGDEGRGLRLRRSGDTTRGEESDGKGETFHRASMQIGPMGVKPSSFPTHRWRENQGGAMHDRPCGWLADGMSKAFRIVAPSTSADTRLRQGYAGQAVPPLLGLETPQAACTKEGRCMIAHAHG
jgi:hypothetical protein